jgi:hypothetical protein
VEGLKWLEIKGFGRFCLFGANGSKEMIISVIGNISKTPFSEGCGYYFTF